MLQDTCYVSCSCNATPTAADWGPNDLICYASCNSVVIYDPQHGQGGKVIETLVKHTDRVNSVRWIVGSTSSELVSGSSDGTAVVWTKVDEKYKNTVLKGHESSINIVDGLCFKVRTVVISISMDCTGKIWTKDKDADEFSLCQTLNYGYSTCTSVRLAPWSDADSIILACALDNSTIQLYVQNRDDFAIATTLKGHEDCVRGLDFTTDANGNLILASSAQDLYIRLWQISTHNLNPASPNLFTVNGNEYDVYVDSVLMGHEGWVYSVAWNPKKMQLLSSSLDKSLVVWEVDKDTNLWVESLRVGEVGGNILGFYGAVFSRNGLSILGHGYNGALHIWTQNTDAIWQPCVTVGGHFDQVTDLAWEPQGEFLMSVSTDQTCRIHAPWFRPGKPVTWHEIARPQIHGYDMNALALLSRYQYASSAEEKVIRTFRAPDDFVENFKRICRIDDSEIVQGVKGASVPSLGLSNKAAYNNDLVFTSVILEQPPTEETLLQNTLWPEVQKLYGHGYEVYSLAASPDGRLLASSCKATTPEHAAILLWDSSNWKLIQKLHSHTLTVVQIEFSPDSNNLLSVSRDRRWSLFRKNNEASFELIATTDKKSAVHTRIIWCCAWTHDSKYFATGSRDGKLVVWNRESPEKHPVLGNVAPSSNHLDLRSESITAIDFAPGFVQNNYLIGAGLDAGSISVYKWLDGHGFALVLKMDQSVAHHLTVKRLAFRPIFGLASDKNNSKDRLQLASCSADHSVKVYNILI